MISLYNGYAFTLLVSCMLFEETVAISTTLDKETSFIYDPETNQHFPISEFSKKEDPQFILPDPDPAVFPPDYLNALLQHCDDPIPGIFEFFKNVLTAFREFSFNWSRYPVSFGLLIRILQAIRAVQLFHCVVVAVLLSVFRFIVQKMFLTVIVEKVGISKLSSARLLESSWKSFCFLVMWLFSLHVVVFSGRTDFQYPLQIFRNVRLEVILFPINFNLVGYFDVPTPSDIYRVYVLQLGFYLHSLWSLFYTDTWRKDSPVLMVHHVMTLLLLEFSLVLRLHRIGVLVVFLHDLNDVFLELAKVNVYLRDRNGENNEIHVKLSNFFFIIFTFTWVVMRLYWFPFKVLYATSWGVYIAMVGRECRSFLFFNTMLWALFLMHIYWFRFISIMAIRLITCQSSDDIREVEASEEFDADDCKHRQCNGVSTAGDDQEEHKRKAN